MARKVTFDALTLERHGTLTEEQWESMTEDQQLRIQIIQYLKHCTGKNLRAVFSVTKHMALKL